MFYKTNTVLRLSWPRLLLYVLEAYTLIFTLDVKNWGYWSVTDSS